MNANKIIQTIYDDSRKRRVIIFHRNDGSFGFEEEFFSDEPLELAWLPSGRDLVEACGRVEWLAERAPDQARKPAAPGTEH
jgi:hypothetical protein